MPQQPEHDGTVFDVQAQTLTCVRCSKDFQGVVVVIEGHSTASRICGLCANMERQPWDDPPARSPILARAEKMGDLLHQVGVNVRRHGNCTLESDVSSGEPFDTSEAGEAPLIAAREFVTEVVESAKWAAVRGLLICGATGTGKTHLAVGILRSLLLNPKIQPERLIFDRAARLITDIQDTYGTGQTGAMLEKREQAHVWVLDDLGSEKATPDALRILHDLLDAREGHPTVITSNLTPKEMGERFRSEAEWVRLSSRLARRNFRAVLVKGSDRRFAA